MMMPSKKLISTVLNLDIDDIKNIDNNVKETITIWKGVQNTFPKKFHTGIDINIYELMHLMKEWAHDEGYQVIVYKEYDGTYLVRIYDKYSKQEVYSWWNVPKFEAVTKACEWILEQTNEPK